MKKIKVLMVIHAKLINLIYQIQNKMIIYMENLWMHHLNKKFQIVILKIKNWSAIVDKVMVHKFKIINLLLKINLIPATVLKDIWIKTIPIRQLIRSIQEVSFLIMSKEDLLQVYRTIMMIIRSLIIINMKMTKYINQTIISLSLLKIYLKSEVIICKENLPIWIILRLKISKILIVLMRKHLKMMIES